MMVAQTETCSPGNFIEYLVTCDSPIVVFDGLISLIKFREASWFMVVTKYWGISTEQIKEVVATPISMLRRDETWIQKYAWETWRNEITWEKRVRKVNSWDRAVGIVSRPWTGQPRNRGSISGSPEIFLHPPKRPNSLWSPPSPLFNGYQGRFPSGKATNEWSWSFTSIYCRG